MFSGFFSGLAKAIITWSIEEVMSFLVRSKWAQPKPKLKEIPYASGIMNTKDTFWLGAVKR